MRHPEESNPPRAAKQTGASKEHQESTKIDNETQPVVLSAVNSRADRKAIIAAATEYAKRGFSVVPLGARRTPTCQLEPRFIHAASAEHVPDWFRRQRGLAGVGIVLGRVSGNLFSRDFDKVDAYERWRDAQPELAKTLPTVRTNRGFHVYGRWAGVRTIKFEDGELRGERHYVCAPPSNHEAGIVYEWVVPLPSGDVPEVDPFVIGLAGNGSPPEGWGEGCSTSECPRESEKQRSRDTEIPETQRNRDTQAIQETSTEIREQIELAISKTVPTKVQTRNRAVFNFVRELMAIPELRVIKGNLTCFKPIMHEWYKRARKFAATQDFTEYWTDFTNAWQKARLAAGEDVLGKAITLAEQADPPAWAARYSDKVKFLASLCRELQRLKHPEPFFLSHRNAGKAVNEGHRTAGRWLNMFIGDGALREVTKGGPETNLATRYFYIANDL